MTQRSTFRKIWWGSAAVVTFTMAFMVIRYVDIQPIRALGGAVWLKHGVKYINDAEITNRINKLNAPSEATMSEKIRVSSATCDSLESGYCQKTPGEYVFKSLVRPAIPYSPGTPDKKEVIGYCTACNDGTFSPSCAVGRGACSWHGGVAAYNVAQFRITPGTPAIQAVEAVYSFEPKSYKDSPIYVSPEIPSLNVIAGF